MSFSIFSSRAGFFFWLPFLSLLELFAIMLLISLSLEIPISLEPFPVAYSAALNSIFLEIKMHASQFPLTSPYFHFLNLIFSLIRLTSVIQFLWIPVVLLKFRLNKKGPETNIDIKDLWPFEDNIRNLETVFMAIEM